MVIYAFSLQTWKFRHDVHARPQACAQSVCLINCLYVPTAIILLSGKNNLSVLSFSFASLLNKLLRKSTDLSALFNLEFDILEGMIEFLI